MFSRFNSPCSNVALIKDDYLLKIDESFNPCSLKRETNMWSLYFGKYPTFCALITDEVGIQERISDGFRHVLQVPVNFNSGSTFTKRDVVDKIARIIQQLEKLGIEWKKKASHFTINVGEIVNMDVFVCNDSGQFHVLVYMDSIDGTRPEANSHEINQLILSIRSIFLDRDPISNFPLLKRSFWEMSVHLTIVPDFHEVEFVPEWLTIDDFADWHLPATLATPQWIVDDNSDWIFPLDIN